MIDVPVRPKGPKTAERTLSLQDVWRPRTLRRDVKPGLEQIHAIDVAPSGWSAERCEEGHFLPDSYPATSPMWTTCACGKSQDDDRIAVRQSSIPLLTDPVHANFAIWWHVSGSLKLFLNDQDVELHWGEFDTVMHYYVTRSDHRGWAGRATDPRYLYSAMLREGADVNTKAFIENQPADEHRAILGTYVQGGPVRYLNARERPGSVSIVARKTDFEVIDCIDLWNQGGA
ncbi:hypothetical protein QN357_14620 [Cryobacterium sp. RTC2.1]|uniref:hypothetical protein n=1 Tax=Cryobacterium sp. RTC2.1 TaxID=3048634 RepID=UPI002B2222A8|nr:hypothetical protein [Cryobacterium sp. RTC2.1]MEB0004163.1 hypothetical protein [Cryobacterium sp. RTC2.1]